MAKKDGIYKRGKTYWITYTDASGKRRWESSKSQYYAAADKLLAIRKTETAQGKLPEILAKRERTPFSELAEKYIEFCAHQKNSRDKSNIVNNFLVPYFGKKDVSSIKISEFESFYSKQLGSVSTSTANRRFATLKNMITKAADWGFASDESLKAVRKIKLHSEKETWRLRYLSHEEATELLNVCSGDLRDIVVMALSTGMRRGEILDLQWNYVRLDVGFIYVIKSKGAESRQVPISPDLLEMLTRRSTGIEDQAEYVFPSPVSGGRRESVPGGSSTGFSTACKMAGIENFRFHDLRHTFASWLVMAGVDLTTVSRLMGHKSLAMTLRYSHLAPGHLHSAVKTIPTFNSPVETPKYSYMIEWSEADNSYLAKSPQFPQLISQGNTPAEALKSIELAVTAEASAQKLIENQRDN
ncbi:MAG: hypothetical protein EG822_06750 [Deltaproteobacteria bacterium]|nr:hypothetical protein [Deltaproteobacteria bacterium]TLN02427.1 MAG: hypothetical protein FDZ73_12030 [bacterium]